MKNILIITIVMVSMLMINSCSDNRDAKVVDISAKENNQTDACDDLMLKKPALYLYPIKNQNIDVSLQINGSLVTSIPSYGNDGWHVNVDKEGIIDNQYDYLFYENTFKYIELPKSGWIKNYTELDEWFDSILPRHGLNQKETKQFKEYWLKELKKGKTYEIKTLSQDFLNKNLILNINPKPDSIIRVHFYFKTIDKKYPLQEPIISTPKRFGFTAVEWGGILKE